LTRADTVRLQLGRDPVGKGIKLLPADPTIGIGIQEPWSRNMTYTSSKSRRFLLRRTVAEDAVPDGILTPRTPQHLRLTPERLWLWPR
jgi:hypothetical protein